MDTSNHNLEGLFLQLGLSDSPESIENFISNHHLPNDIPLDRAAFWSLSQAQFIREAIEQDAEWAEAVDHLDAQLRH